MSRLHRIGSYINYRLGAVKGRSPLPIFVNDFCSTVLKPQKRIFIKDIEQLRARFQQSKSSLEVEDLGTGSQKGKTRIRRIRDIATYGMTKPKYSKIMADIIDYMRYENIVELGTSLGINTLYLSAHPQSGVTTFEGSTAIAAIAQKLFDVHRNNVSLIIGDIDRTLPKFLKKSEPLDMVYFDANHCFDATIRYFELCLTQSHNHTCLIFDDIHLTREMSEAWNTLQRDNRITLSIDLFQIGIAFINPELAKQHYVINV